MRTLSVIFLWMVMSFVSFAQDNYRISSFGVDEGLPQNSVWGITQDGNGFLWVCTSDGVCRFDGYKFTVYKNDPKDSNSICGNQDHGLFVDRQGKLWIISSNGISLYNELTDNFTTIFTYESRIPSNFFNTIFGEDEQYVWAGFANFGLVKVDKATKQVTRIANAGGHDLTNFNAWNGGFAEHDRLWICTRNGFYSYDTHLNVFEKISDIEWLNSAISLNDSEVIAGGDRCLLICNKKRKTFIVQPVDLNSSNREVISGLMRVSDDELLLACHNGIFYYSIPAKKVVRSIISFDEQQKNKYAFARCLYRDRANNLWIGTNGDGLKKINYPYKKFLAYSSHSEISNLVKSIYADSQRIYVGYFGNGLDIFDRRRGFVKNVSFLKLGISENCGYAVTRLNADELLIHVATQNRVLIYNSSSSALRLISPRLKMLLRPAEHTETTMYPFFLTRSDGRILTAAGANLIALTEHHRTDITPVLVHRFEGEILCCCFEDSKGCLWIGSMSGVYFCKDSVWNKVSLRGSVQVKAINQDLSGNIWLGTVKGIYVLDSGKNISNYFSETNSLVNQFVYGILRDDDGNMWFSHNKGLSVYKMKTKEFRHYYKEDGLQSSEFNSNAYFKAADGTLFFGGLNGINAFDPREIHDNPNVPPVKITSIKLFDEPLKTDTAYWNIHSLTLPYMQNSLSFEFAAPEFTNAGNNQYAYTMDGVDNAWIKSGDKRFARYPALPPGQYTFRVKASNSDGVWQQVPTEIQITILPPFWQRLWFRIAIALLLIAGIAGVIYSLQKQKHQRQIRSLELQQKIQLERERISRDLHDNVGTQLSLISNNIEWVAHPLKTITEEEKAEKLQFVNETARDIIATLRETIWALNKHEIPLEEFSDKLKSFVQKQLVMYPEIELNFIERIEQSIILGPSEALNLFRICQEAIANALKYANAAVIDIEIVSGEGKYKVSITDNGRGFDITAVSPAVQNGLENMKHRAQDIDSRLDIQTNSSGTKITVTKK